VAAEAAEAAGPAEAADAALAAELPAEVAARLGGLAAGASPVSSPISLTTLVIMAGFDNVDPANRVLEASPWEGLVGLQPNQEMPARWLDEGISVVKKYALHRRLCVQGKLHVLTS
jgi:hypothetical protein